MLVKNIPNCSLKLLSEILYQTFWVLKSSKSKCIFFLVSSGLYLTTFPWMSLLHSVCHIKNLFLIDTVQAGKVIHHFKSHLFVIWFYLYICNIVISIFYIQPPPNYLYICIQLIIWHCVLLFETLRFNRPGCH